MDENAFLQMLSSGGGMPGAQASQNAAPSVQQPGGGPQMVNGLTPDQQQLFNAFDLLVTQGDQLSSGLKRMGMKTEANDVDAAMVKITKLKLSIEAEMKEEAIDKALSQAVNPSQAQTQSMV